MSKGKTFKVGKLLVNISERGVATKDPESGEIRRYPFPWAKAPEQNPESQNEAPYEEEYDENGYEPQAYDEPEYDQDGEYQEDDDYEQQPGILDSAWLMWAALIVLPPLGIWLLWRSKRFNITWNTAISALSALWFLILLILLFSRMNRNNEDINLPPLVTPTPTIEATATPTPSPTPSATAIPEITPTPTIAPAATPQTGNTGTDPQQGAEPTASAEPTFVWSKEGGKNYHADSTCGGMKDATRVSLAVALNRRQTACPDCMPIEQATPAPTATALPAGSYFSRPDGSWYHLDPNCKGMTSAQVVTLAEALARNQTACDTCIGSVYMTDGGTWYHSVSNCKNMTGAYLTTVDKAIAAGKIACDQCMGGTATGNTGTTVTGNNGGGSDIFYYNPDGKWYHKTENCGGMKGAVKGTAAAAENNGKTPCPTCLGGTSANAKFYATTNGTWYHTKSNCQGMTNAVRITEATAIARGKTACPECAGGVATGGTTVNVNTGNTANQNNTTVSAQATTLYSTTDGDYYHSIDDCTGMKGATEVDADDIAERDQEPCPRCIGTSGVYYSTLNGTYYHSKANCTGMKDPDIVTLAMINARKQSACPDCIGGGVTGKVYYWANANGAYYHSKSNCTGMKGAVKVTEDEAEDNGQLPCPTCVGSVWGTKDGDHYHKDKKCSGMKNAGHLTIQQAEKEGKTACPKCIINATPTPKPTATPKPGEDDNDSSLFYYATNDGSYYHREDDCTGMKGAKKVSEKDAIARGQKPCPECIGSVWATEDGDHYHATKNCSGMKGASLVTVDTAELRGQSPCPDCLSDGDLGAPQPGDNVVTDTDKVNVYCTLEGHYYHSEKTCGGMKNAASVSLTWALEHNYTRCDDCDAPHVR